MKLKTVNAPDVKSLVWSGDTLVDWISGGDTYSLEGASEASRVHYPYTFNEAISSRSGKYVVLVSRRSTKALLLRNGKLIRELNRSYYCAESYDYPVAFVTLSDGREAIAHCPNEYNQLEVEIAETGELLKSTSDRKPSDYFHARLKVSPNNRYLASCGWVWHPVDYPHIFDIQTAEKNLSHLDGPGVELRTLADTSSLAFVSDHEIVVALGGDVIDQEIPIDGTELYTFAIHEGLAHRQSVAKYSGHVSLVCGFSGGGVLALGDHPVVLDQRTGDVLNAWPDLSTTTVAIGALGDSARQDFIFAARHDGCGFALWRDGKLSIAM